MKKYLLLISLLSSQLSFGQLHPNSSSPTGFLNSFDDGTNYVYGANNGVNTSVTNLGSEIRVDVGAGAATWEGVGIQAYDKGTTGAAAYPDITNTPVVYVKMKGTVGDTIRLDLKNGATFTFVDGWNHMQEISCSNYQWYKFDFSSNLPPDDVDQISEVAINVNPQTTGVTKQFFIDSIVFGTNTINPNPVIDINTISYVTDLSQAVGFYNYAHNDPNTTINKIGQTYQVTIGSGAGASDGIAFQPYSNGALSYPDISSEPKVWIKASATVDDTIRVDLKNGTGFDFVNGYDYNIKVTSATSQWYEFDFTASPELMDSIVEIGISINPNTSTTETITIDSIRIGNFDLDPCTETVISGINSEVNSIEFSVYPNPASDIVSINSPNDLSQTTITIINSQGILVESFDSNNNQVDVSNLSPGVYFVNMISNFGQATRRLVIY